MSLSLKAKLAVVGLVPFAAFLVQTGVELRANYQAGVRADAAARAAKLFLATSDLIHQLQTERGKSNLFMNGDVPLAELESQRKETDARLAALNEHGLEQGSLGDASSQQLNALRHDVQSKAKSVPEIVRAYNEMVGSLMQFGLKLTSQAAGSLVERRMVSAAILESAKDSAGRLRAIMLGAIEGDAPLTSDALKALMAAKAGVDVNLSSRGLALSEESERAKEALLVSPEWKAFEEAFAVVVSRASTGRFGLPSREVFANVTKSMDRLRNIIHAETTLVRSQAEALKAERDLDSRVLLAWAVGFALGLAALIWRTVGSIVRPIWSAVADLNESSRQIGGASSSLRAASESIASAVTESASSLQETSSAVVEITSMITKNSEASERARRTSEVGRSRMAESKDAAAEMAASIEEISRAQERMANEFEASNSRVSAIVGVIDGIQEKTKIINDIVFQTKLLSFNASVEAARAGEHGKGFAVVAEEIGSLAAMSGRAAQEISELLNQSTQNVKKTVGEATAAVSRQMEEGREKVSVGKTTLERLVATFDQAFGDFGEMIEMIAAISVASKEQASGAAEVSTAIEHLDQATNTNSSSAEQAARSAQSLADEARRLKAVVDSLNQTITGGTSKPIVVGSPRSADAAAAEENEIDRIAA